MGKHLLNESTTTQVKPTGARWRAVLITPGQGSSGKYSETALAEAQTAAVFPKGTTHYFKHPEKPDEQRDPRDKWGVSAEDAHFEPGVGLVSEIDILPHWQTVVESLAEAGEAHLSIWAMGETDNDGNVTALYPDTQNTVDLVAFPGRPGSKLTTQMYESARAASDEAPVVTSAQDNQEGEIVDEVLKELRALAALLTPLAAFVTESKTADAAKKAEVDADALTEAAEKLAKAAVESYSEKASAIEKAEILPSQKAELLEQAKTGVDVTPLIESAVKIVAEAKTVLSESAGKSGYVQESAAGEDFAVEGWAA